MTPTDATPTDDRSGSDAAFTPDPRVRRARPGEAEVLARIQQHLREPSPDLLEYGLAVDALRVSVDTAGTPVGYLLPVDGEDAIHLAEMAVLPEARREGRARGLMETVLAETTGPVTLLVAPENDAARALYDDLGFEVVDRRPDAYAEGDGDALCYRLDR
jgi:ribosomal-protein-alanine N-acetyltransferase